MTFTTLNPILRAEDLFDNLDKEEREPEDLRIKVEKSERLEEIVKGFEKAMIVDENSLEKYYNEILRLIQITPNSKEILEFSILMGNYQDYINFKRNSGLYLSALINKSNEQEIIINTFHLEKIPSFLGINNNGKTIHINEDAGDYFGTSMIKGTIHVGNVVNYLGEDMKGGTIYAENAGDSVGYSMQGGTIHVKNATFNLGQNMQGGTIHVKNAGYFVGPNMEVGTIYIENSYEYLSNDIKGGNIYFQNKLIVKDGVKLI
jgi:formylmethanofuran dehydrogenase subunit C